MPKGNYTPKTLTSPVEKIVKDLYSKGYSRSAIGTTLRSEGIRIDNNSIQNFINEQKNRLTKPYAEHIKNARHIRNIPYVEKVDNAYELVKGKKYQKLIKEANYPQLSESSSEGRVLEINPETTDEKLNRYIGNALKKNLLASSHSYQRIAIIAFDNPIKYSRRRHPVNSLIKGIADADNLRRIFQIQEDYEAEGVQSEIKFYDYTEGYVSLDDMREWVK